MAGRAVIVALSAVLLISPIDAGAITIFDDAGANTVAIQDTVDAFRAALGNPNNMNNPGPLATGRREINWDGGGPAGTRRRRRSHPLRDLSEHAGWYFHHAGRRPNPGGGDRRVTEPRPDQYDGSHPLFARQPHA